MTIPLAMVDSEVTESAVVCALDAVNSETAHHGTSAAERLIALHHFQFPRAEFQISMHSGSALPECAARLVDDAYSRLGYLSSVRDSSHRDSEGSAVLEAVHEDRILGTLSVNLDSSRGLKAEVLYPDEIATFRDQGPICEFTRLALDRNVAGREVLCSLFYMAYLFAHAARSVKHLVIEVNPRHEAFYARMLGFKRIGQERVCRRVNAPAVLMHLDFEFTRIQIDRYRHGLSVASAALYGYAAPAYAERRLVRRMISALALIPMRRLKSADTGGGGPTLLRAPL